MKFTDLDLDHKRQLLLNFRIQNALAYELVEAKQISIEDLIAKAAEKYYPQIEDFSEDEINCMVHHVEKLFTSLKQSMNARLN